MEFILWVVILGGGTSQAAALFPHHQACNQAKEQMLFAIKQTRTNVITVAECLPRDGRPHIGADPMSRN